ncbi:MAG TPA: hypothetical protein VM911_13880 [Pyrinomonadaceae bacterium]|jgi:hypothetical protein|nr:hypothetical protein [Pyrinomonadaceae bacterium]
MTIALALYYMIVQSKKAAPNLSWILAKWHQPLSHTCKVNISNTLGCAKRVPARPKQIEQDQKEESRNALKIEQSGSLAKPDQTTS